MTYAELVTAVQNYLENSEAKFVASIPLFVDAVENRVYNEVQLPALRKNVTGFLEAGYRYLVVPADFLSVFSFALIHPTTGVYDYILFKDVNYIREVYTSPTVTGQPKVYGQFDSESFILGPTPDLAYAAELHYFYYPESLVTAGTSWVATNFPSVMLYGVIAEGDRFLKGDAAQQQVYDGQYMNALNLLRKLGEGRQRDDAFSTTYTKPNAATLGE